ncbi:MAG: class I SAM-dependent methyltransferase [Thermoplasmata archaeon]|nr:class I SAM-dependent methyltransferase [Thermoplasmata archaeon]
MCGVAFFWPLPGVGELAPQYEWNGYARVTYEGPEPSREHRIGYLCALLEGVEAMTGGPGSLVDMGCSSGHFLEAGRRRGWKATGIELDPETARRTSERCQVPVIAGSGVEELDRLGEFDLIVMSHWLEHLPDPYRAFSVARRHLTPNGRILLRVPNADSQLARATGVTWSWFIPGIHLFYFGPRSIRALARRSGLEVGQLRSGRGDAHPLPVEIAVAAFRGLSAGPGELDRRGGRSRSALRSSASQLLGGRMYGLERGLGAFALREDPDGPELVAVLKIPRPGGSPGAP